MIIMALDHVRDFFHFTAFTDSPDEPAHHYPLVIFYPLDNPFLRARFFISFRHFCLPDGSEKNKEGIECPFW